tara:strand:- start:1146 stop:1352 length:207 start_codon:yes stop_codon:yes gene_type:complete
MTIGIHSAILIKDQKMILKDALLLYVSDLQKKHFSAKVIGKDDYLSKMKEVEEIVRILHLDDLYKYAS